MIILCLHKRIAFLFGLFCFFVNTSIIAQDTTTNPIRFFKIEKATNNTAVNISWAIAVPNNDSVQITIDRSADGKNFQLLAIIPAYFSETDSNYNNYTDNFPYSDSSFYRITCANSMALSYSAVQKINFFSRPKIEITVMPNPVFNNASLIIQTEETGDINCMLYDLSGKIIRTYQFKKNNQYVQHILDMYNVPRGEYVLNITSATINESKRILKQ